MKATQFAHFGIIPAALLTIACGDDVTQVTKIEETSGLEVVASADSLGKCTAEISGEMKFATKENAVYVCADSAWKNVSETEKTTCSAEALSDGSGFKIVCDGDSIGVVKNGEKGDKGNAGKDGKDGENCEILDNGDGTVSVVCGDASTTLYKAFCEGELFNPDSNLCLEGKLYKNKTLVWNLMNPNIKYDVFVDDRDGQVYRSVEIGGKTWMAENLNYETDGSYCYNDSSENCQKYGRLYSFNAAYTSTCPKGWRIPTKTEFEELADSVGGKEISGKSLKSASGWEHDGSGLDNHGFSALPAGMRYGENDFDELGYTANFWSSIFFAAADNPLSLKEAHFLSLNFSSDIADLKHELLAYAFSVRCVRD